MILPGCKLSLAFKWDLVDDSPEKNSGAPSGASPFFIQYGISYTPCIQFFGLLQSVYSTKTPLGTTACFTIDFFIKPNYPNRHNTAPIIFSIGDTFRGIGIGLDYNDGYGKSKFGVAGYGDAPEIYFQTAYGKVYYTGYVLSDIRSWYRISFFAEPIGISPYSKVTFRIHNFPNDWSVIIPHYELYGGWCLGGWVNRGPSQLTADVDELQVYDRIVNPDDLHSPFDGEVWGFMKNLKLAKPAEMHKFIIAEKSRPLSTLKDNFILDLHDRRKEAGTREFVNYSGISTKDLPARIMRMKEIKRFAFNRDFVIPDHIKEVAIERAIRADRFYKATRDVNLHITKEKHILGRDRDVLMLERYKHPDVIRNFVELNFTKTRGIDYIVKLMAKWYYSIDYKLVDQSIRQFSVDFPWVLATSHTESILRKTVLMNTGAREPAKRDWRFNDRYRGHEINYAAFFLHTEEIIRDTRLRYNVIKYAGDLHFSSVEEKNIPIAVYYSAKGDRYLSPDAPKIELKNSKLLNVTTSDLAASKPKYLSLADELVTVISHRRFEGQLLDINLANSHTEKVDMLFNSHVLTGLASNFDISLFDDRYRAYERYDIDITEPKYKSGVTPNMMSKLPIYKMELGNREFKDDVMRKVSILLSLDSYLPINWKVIDAYDISDYSKSNTHVVERSNIVPATPKYHTGDKVNKYVEAVNIASAYDLVMSAGGRTSYSSESLEFRQQLSRLILGEDRSIADSLRSYHESKEMGFTSPSRQYDGNTIDLASYERAGHQSETIGFNVNVAASKTSEELIFSNKLRTVGVTIGLEFSSSLLSLAKSIMSITVNDKSSNIVESLKFTTSQRVSHGSEEISANNYAKIDTFAILPDIASYAKTIATQDASPYVMNLRAMAPVLLNSIASYASQLAKHSLSIGSYAKTIAAQDAMPYTTNLASMHGYESLGVANYASIKTLSEAFSYGSYATNKAMTSVVPMTINQMSLAEFKSLDYALSISHAFASKMTEFVSSLNTSKDAELFEMASYSNDIPAPETLAYVDEPKSLAAYGLSMEDTVKIPKPVKVLDLSWRPAEVRARDLSEFKADLVQMTGVDSTLRMWTDNKTLSMSSGELHVQPLRERIYQEDNGLVDIPQKRTGNILPILSLDIEFNKKVEALVFRSITRQDLSASLDLNDYLDNGAAVTTQVKEKPASTATSIDMSLTLAMKDHSLTGYDFTSILKLDAPKIDPIISDIIKTYLTHSMDINAYGSAYKDGIDTRFASSLLVYGYGKNEVVEYASSRWDRKDSIGFSNHIDSKTPTSPFYAVVLQDKIAIDLNKSIVSYARYINPLNQRSFHNYVPDRSKLETYFLNEVGVKHTMETYMMQDFTNDLSFFEYAYETQQRYIRETAPVVVTDVPLHNKAMQKFVYVQYEFSPRALRNKMMTDSKTIKHSGVQPYTATQVKSHDFYRDVHNYFSKRDMYSKEYVDQQRNSKHYEKGVAFNSRDSKLYTREMHNYETPIHQSDTLGYAAAPLRTRAKDIIGPRWKKADVPAHYKETYMIIKGKATLVTVPPWRKRLNERAWYFVSGYVRSAGGVITPTRTANLTGRSQTVTIVPDNGFIISQVMIDGVDQPISDTYVFNNISTNHQIEVWFVRP